MKAMQTHVKNVEALVQKPDSFDSLSLAVELARDLGPDLVLQLMTLVGTASPDIKVKASRCIISIMSIDRSRIA